ncbi:MAG: hypothetical protein LLF76_03145 [Planctomycetaceae bacterium]|nr:hypothetical protein [Planctomycetaceae bacterium]
MGATREILEHIQQLVHAFEHGASVDDLVGQFGGSKWTIRKLLVAKIGERRFEQIAAAHMHDRPMPETAAAVMPSGPVDLREAPGVLNIHSGRFLERCLGYIQD